MQANRRPDPARTIWEDRRPLPDPALADPEARRRRVAAELRRAAVAGAILLAALAAVVAVLVWEFASEGGSGGAAELSLFLGVPVIGGGGFALARTLMAARRSSRGLAQPRPSSEYFPDHL